MFILGMLTMYFALNISLLIVEMVRTWDKRHTWRPIRFLAFIFIGLLNLYFE